jgi:hypothetical protein
LEKEGKKKKTMEGNVLFQLFSSTLSPTTAERTSAEKQLKEVCHYLLFLLVPSCSFHWLFCNIFEEKEEITLEKNEREGESLQKGPLFEPTLSLQRI